LQELHIYNTNHISKQKPQFFGFRSGLLSLHQIFLHRF
jgi:hypothetical protein